MIPRLLCSIHHFFKIYEFQSDSELTAKMLQLTDLVKPYNNGEFFK